MSSVASGTCSLRSVFALLQTRHLISSQKYIRVMELSSPPTLKGKVAFPVCCTEMWTPGLKR